MQAVFPDNKFISLSQLLIQVRNVMAREFPLPVWVKADMLKLNHYSGSGHAFPELVEKSGGKVVAKTQAIIWADDFLRIAVNFETITGKKLGDGIGILFRTELRFHELYGMRLRIIEIDAQYTLGQMALEKKKTIEKLQAENLYQLNKQLPLATIPQRFAVISAASSRGFSDLRNILRVEGAAFRMELKLFTAVLQGEKGADTIARRLAQIGKRKEEFDAVLIIRGGGDDTGMDCYDSYKMAQAVCTCPLPVITGIGHSTNETVVEMVAHTNKITPTDVGYFILSKFAIQLQILENITGKLTADLLMLISEHEQYLDDAAQMVFNLSRDKFQNQKDLLRRIENVLQAETNSTTTQLKQGLIAKTLLIGNLSKNKLLQLNHRNQLLEQKMQQWALQWQYQNTSALNLLESKIKMLDPEQVLKRGYSITLHNGKIVKNPKKLREGDLLETIFPEGRVESTVKKSKKQQP